MTIIYIDNLSRSRFVKYPTTDAEARKYLIYLRKLVLDSLADIHARIPLKNTVYYDNFIAPELKTMDVQAVANAIAKSIISPFDDFIEEPEEKEEEKDTPQPEEEDKTKNRLKDAISKIFLDLGIDPNEKVEEEKKEEELEEELEEEPEEEPEEKIIEEIKEAIITIQSFRQRINRSILARRFSFLQISENFPKKDTPIFFKSKTKSLKARFKNTYKKPILDPLGLLKGIYLTISRLKVRSLKVNPKPLKSAPTIVMRESPLSKLYKKMPKKMSFSKDISYPNQKTKPNKYNSHNSFQKQQHIQVPNKKENIMRKYPMTAKQYAFSLMPKSKSNKPEPESKNIIPERSTATYKIIRETDLDIIAHNARYFPDPNKPTRKIISEKKNKSWKNK